MAKFVSLASLVIAGVIFADILANASAFATAAGGTQYILNPTFDALLGKAP
jgi:hypothetical protein